jgi:hypothetical protein
MIVSCLPVLVLALALGTALAHMLRADTAPGHGTRGPAPRPVPRGPGRAIPGPDRERWDTRRPRSSRPDSNGPAAGPPPRPEDQCTGSGRDRPGTPDRQQARRSGKASITAGLAQQGDQGGSNAALNALAREINAELAGTSRAAPGIGGAAA